MSPVRDRATAHSAAMIAGRRGDGERLMRTGLPGRSGRGRPRGPPCRCREEEQAPEQRDTAGAARRSRHAVVQAVPFRLKPFGCAKVPL
ncbi:hypothetical protein GCM10010398_60680 [Streptomyces fimbriatus]